MKTPCSAGDGSVMRSRTELGSSEEGGWAGGGVWPERSEVGAAVNGIVEPVGGHHQSLLTALPPAVPMKTIAGCFVLRRLWTRLARARTSGMFEYRLH